MRKNFFFAVVSIMMLCCTVLSSCSEDAYEAEFTPKQEKATLQKLSCEVIQNSFSGNDVIATRATTIDGTFTATSKHEMLFAYGTQKLQRTYTGTNKVDAYRVNRPRYATKIDIFNKATFIENSPLADGRISYTVRFNDSGRDFDFDLIETQTYDTDTVIVMGESFNKCKNSFIKRELDGEPTVVDLQKDSADWHAYSITIPFKYTLEMGKNNIGKFNVKISKVWVAKAGSNPNIPDDEYETVAFEDKDHKFEYVNDTTSRASFTLVRFLSNGEKVDDKTISVLLKNTLTAPEYQTKIVSSLEWKAGNATSASAVKNGELYQKETNIFVQPYKQLYTTRTDKCDAVFTATYEGSAYYVDSLGKAHNFLEKSWEFEDKNWSDKELEATTEYDRLLLTSAISGSFNAHNHDRKAEVELKCRKGSAADIIKYEYQDFGIKSVVPNKEYYTYCDQYAVYSDESKEKVGTIGINIYMSVNTPEKQTIDVPDWDIKDTKATETKAIREDSREQKTDNGTFNVQKYYKNFTTNTNKSACKFVAHYEDNIVFTDKFGKEVEFKGIELSFTDNGSKIEDLSEQDEKERKLLTSTIKVACGSDSDSYSGQVEFHKAIEKEEEEALESWSKTQDLKYKGNGIWTTTTVITYNYKLAGQKTETISQDLIWNLTGEAKKQVILSTASADYKTMTKGTENSETTTNGNITIVTKTLNITEDYTNLSDIYTQTCQTASYKAEVLGKDISFDFLAPSSINIAHQDGSLVDANRTTDKDGITYNVHNHTGSVKATVDNETLYATVEKEVLVAKPIEPYNPKLGNVVELVAATLCYEPNIGANQQGAFHKCLVIKFEKGIVLAVTKTHGANAYDFETTEFIYGEDINANDIVNSAALFDGKWIPALITTHGGGWDYITIDDRIVKMDQELAVLADIKNFNSQSTAANNPYLNYSGVVSNDKVLTVKNQDGTAIFTIN